LLQLKRYQDPRSFSCSPRPLISSRNV